MTFTFRGCGESEGDFSLAGWIDDLRRRHRPPRRGRPSPTASGWSGTDTGGSLALCVGADDPRVRGVALLGARADFDDWAGQPRRFLEHAREHRRHPHAVVPGQVRRVGPRAARLPPPRRGPPPRRRGRCSCSTATTTTPCRSVDARLFAQAHGRPSCASSAGPVIASATTRGPSPSCSAGSTASATSSGADAALSLELVWPRAGALPSVCRPAHFSADCTTIPSSPGRTDCRGGSGSMSAWQVRNGIAVVGITGGIGCRRPCREGRRFKAREETSDDVSRIGGPRTSA